MIMYDNIASWWRNCDKLFSETFIQKIIDKADS